MIVPTQIILQSGPRAVAASQQELRGATGGTVNQPHRQLQDGRVGYRRSGGGQVSLTQLRALPLTPLPSMHFSFRTVSTDALKSVFVGFWTTDRAARATISLFHGVYKSKWFTSLLHLAQTFITYDIIWLWHIWLHNRHYGISQCFFVIVCVMAAFVPLSICAILLATVIRFI